MRKIHLARSGFLDPIISTVPGVGFMRLYAIVEKWGGSYDQIAQDCARGRLPHMRLHDNLFVLVDFRDDPNGMGGKFYTDNHYPKGTLSQSGQIANSPCLKSKNQILQETSYSACN